MCMDGELNLKTLYPFLNLLAPIWYITFCVVYTLSSFALVPNEPLSTLHTYVHGGGIELEMSWSLSLPSNPCAWCSLHSFQTSHSLSSTRVCMVLIALVPKEPLSTLHTCVHGGGIELESSWYSLHSFQMSHSLPSTSVCKRWN